MFSKIHTHAGYFHFQKSSPKKLSQVSYQVNKNCYLPKSGMCFINCNNYYTKNDYTEEFLTLSRNEKYWSELRTSASYQPFCRKYKINIACFAGTRRNPRNITWSNIASKIQNNHFCLIWKTNDNKINEAIEDKLKPNIKVVDNVTSDKHVKNYIKY